MDRSISKTKSAFALYNHYIRFFILCISLKETLCASLPELSQNSIVDACEGNHQNTTCGDDNHVCMYLDACNTVDIYKLKHENFCNAFCGIVCCPKPKPIIAKVGPRFGLLHPKTHPEKVCEEYQQMKNQTCPRSFIFNGRKAAPKEFPFAALLGCNNTKTGHLDWQCGGTLISERFVLTAAHCFLSCKIDVVRLGELDHSTTTDATRHRDFNVNAIYEYDFYEFQSKYNDIALIELAENVTFDEYIFPACLPSPTAVYEQFTAIGWGRIDAHNYASHLMKAEFSLQDSDQCAMSDTAQIELSGEIRESTQFCAKNHNPEVDTCQGDSGGPLLALDSNYNCMYIVAGVTSIGSSKCGIGEPSINTKVNLYTKWIERVVWKIKQI